MTAKKRSGGRTTAKGTQPANVKGHGKPGAPVTSAPRSVPGRVDPVQGRAAFGHVGGKARSGHHGGNR